MKVLKNSFKFGTSYLLHSISITNTNIKLLNDVFDHSGGALIIDPQDNYGNSIPALREFITYSGIEFQNSKWTLQNVKRGVYGSFAQPHATGARIVAIPVVEEENIQTEKEKTLENYLKKIL